MKKEITSDQAVGKTIKGFLSSGMSAQMVVYFDDETFTAFGIKKDYDGDIKIITSKMKWLDFGYKEDLFQAEMFSEQEWKAMCDEVDKRSEQTTEREERKQYERLRAKYEK